jgi:glycosyltransferase involved in cell wall biosynthesis
MPLTKKRKNGRFAVVIPLYNHEQKIADVVKQALKLKFPVIVVDDGSTDAGVLKIKKIPGIKIISHKENLGKGAALMTGFCEAAKIADWAITIDADGQHNPSDAISLIKSIPENSKPIIVGMREGMNAADVPWTSSFGRKFSNFWVICSGGPDVMDTQSGFRIYPLPESLQLDVKSQRFQFEVEILVKANWKGIKVIESPISVTYTPGMQRISHFRPFVDFMRNSSAFTRLIFQRIVIPKFIRKKLKVK